MKQNAVVILVTTKDVRQAKALAKHLLIDKRIACANIVSGVQSMFWWQGKVESSREALLIIKTLAKHVGPLTKTIKAMHTYQTPEIIALPIVAAETHYLKWIKESVC